MFCLNNRNPDASMISVPMSNGNIARRVAQYQWLSDDAKKAMFAQKLIRCKVTLQLSSLRKLKSQRPEKLTQFNRAISALQNLRLESLTKPSDSNTSINELMGFEGIAAKHYFSAFSEVFAPGLSFTRRNKRPPRDPLNSILSLTYTMTYFEAIRACHGADHFWNEKSGACLLTKADRKVFYEQLSLVMPLWRKHLRSICVVLAKKLIE
ncbi:CRISPR-associated endonuclease Cas1 [Aliivibrio fischeri]|uniref:CRISPR-associated endonuclease Cas1 n=1 Tax=Aliivibrio fischeri TaxID=668 RepID=UPI003AF55372